MYKHPKRLDKNKRCNDLIEAAKPKLSAGFDNITNIAEKAIVLVVHIFNACIRLGYFPTRWKSTEVIPILKLQKP